MNATKNNTYACVTPKNLIVAVVTLPPEGDCAYIGREENRSRPEIFLTPNYIAVLILKEGKPVCSAAAARVLSSEENRRLIAQGA